MKSLKISTSLLVLIIASTFLLTNCLNSKNPIVYETGTFPDTVVNLGDINSTYDDYNISMYSLYSNLALVFSSNRGSEGGQFDLVQAILSYAFDQTNSAFWLGTEITDDLFLTKLIAKANTTRNDFGPYRLYNANDGNEYMILSSETENGDLDLYYTKNLPAYGNIVPEVNGPFPVTLLNSVSNDAYITFNTGHDTAYFTSDVGGNFDIYSKIRPDGTSLDAWFNQGYEASSAVNVLNSTSDDKCPNVLGDIMVFTSNRPGGLGGYDLYYSVLKNGQWSAPVNFGAPINSVSDEYRPFLGGHADFTNFYLLFSSNRSGGKGGFDLYFTGINLP